MDGLYLLNASWVIFNVVATTQAQKNVLIFCKFFEGIWNNYVDIQQKTSRLDLLCFLCTRGYNSLGDLTRSLKEKHVQTDPKLKASAPISWFYFYFLLLQIIESIFWHGKITSNQLLQSENGENWYAVGVLDLVIVFI